jgi:hypothetical protein
VDRDSWIKVTPGSRVRVEHTEGFVEGTLIVYVARDGWASVDLGEMEVKSRGPVWRGVRHIPYYTITDLQVWTRS